MKRLGKALVALTTATALGAAGFAGVSTAMAVTDGNHMDAEKNSITFSNVVSRDKLSGYQILKLDSVSKPVDGSTKEDLNVIYLLNDNYKTEILAGIENVTTDASATLTDDAAIIKWLTTNLKTGDDVEKFAAGFMSTKPTADPTFKDKVVDNNKSYTVEDQPVGYYLFEHTVIGDDNTADNTVYTKSRYMVDTLLPTTFAADGLQVTLKRGSTTLTKQINVPGDATDATGKYSLGDQVPYLLTGTISEDYEKFGKYQYKFEDKLSKGLTAPEKNAITVKIGNVVYTGADIDITPNDDKTTKITVDLGDLKAVDKANANITIDLNTKITVDYKATVNSDTVIQGDNAAKLVFSNTWNTDDLGETPEQKVTNFVLKLNVLKTNEENKPLDGAEFSIVRADEATDNSANAWVEKATERDAGGNYVVSFNQLGTGRYKVVETKVPDGYNGIDPIEFTVTETTDNEGKVTGLAINGPTGATFTLSGTNEYNLPIQNNSGSQLPSTGGMGTTILYIIGGLIVLAAAGGLTVAVRKRNNN